MQNQSFTTPIINTHTDMPKSFQNHILVAVILIQIVSILHVCQPRSVSRICHRHFHKCQLTYFPPRRSEPSVPIYKPWVLQKYCHTSISAGTVPVPAVWQNTNCLCQRYCEYIWYSGTPWVQPRAHLCCMPIILHIFVWCTATFILRSAFPSFQF